MDDFRIRNTIRRLRRTHGSVYAPLKYFRGLKTVGDVERRYKKMLRKDYKPFPTDKYVKTRTSSHTARFRRKYGTNVRSLPQIARATGIPLTLLKMSYRRGLAAWRTGHRPGATPQQWAQARVHSFVMGGKADPDLRRRLSR